jgi:anti-sigma factor RsiW
MSSQLRKHHPGEDILALYAGGDLDWSERLRVALHVHGCTACGQQVANQRAIRADVASLRQTPAAAAAEIGDWDRLSEEMTANIRLGISAAECVGPAKREPNPFGGFFWKPAVMAASAFVLLTGAFLLNMPLDRIERLWHLRDHSGLVLESSASGIEMRRDGRALMSVRDPDRKSHRVAANLDGSMSLGYVDDETGQVTIINVAGQ